jgi:hypothetical protein
VNLPDRWIAHLRALPESGMGYQRVAVRLVDDRRFEHALVFNAEQLEIKEEVELKPDQIAEITVER